VAPYFLRSYDFVIGGCAPFVSSVYAHQKRAALADLHVRNIDSALKAGAGRQRLSRKQEQSLRLVSVSTVESRIAPKRGRSIEFLSGSDVSSAKKAIKQQALHAFRAIVHETNSSHQLVMTYVHLVCAFVVPGWQFGFARKKYMTA